MSSLSFGEPLLSDTGTSPLHQNAGASSPWTSSPLRRSMEFCAAAGALIAFSPLFLVAAIAVRLGSPGPILFRQKRMGRNGQEFTLYKFRSMYDLGEQGAGITVSGDARITPVGTLLRRCKLDELPQFWNVLKGDMSLVGPRPKLPHHEGLHLCWRPGITGAATLVFREEEQFLSSIPRQDVEHIYEMYVKPAKARLDLEYMQRATIVTDLAIIWQTAAACVLSRKVRR